MTPQSEPRAAPDSRSLSPRCEGFAHDSPEGKPAPVDASQGEYGAFDNLPISAGRHTGVAHAGRAELRAMPIVSRRPEHPLRSYLLDRGVDTLERAYVLLGIPARTLREWFAGRSAPSDLRARGIAEDLGVDPAILFPEPAEQPQDESEVDLTGVFADDE